MQQQVKHSKEKISILNQTLRNASGGGKSLKEFGFHFIRRIRERPGHNHADARLPIFCKEDGTKHKRGAFAVFTLDKARVVLLLPRG